MIYFWKKLHHIRLYTLKVYYILINFQVVKSSNLGQFKVEFPVQVWFTHLLNQFLMLLIRCYVSNMHLFWYFKILWKVILEKIRLTPKLKWFCWWWSLFFYLFFDFIYNKFNKKSLFRRWGVSFGAESRKNRASRLYSVKFRL